MSELLNYKSFNVLYRFISFSCVVIFFGQSNFANASEAIGRNLAICSGYLFKVATQSGSSGQQFFERSDRAYALSQVDLFDVRSDVRENLIMTGRMASFVTAQSNIASCLKLISESDKKIDQEFSIFKEIGKTGEWYKYKDSKYVGPRLNGVPHGKGHLISSSGAIDYRGDFKNGKADGVGNLNDQYDGVFKSGKFTGIGVAYDGYDKSNRGKIIRTAEDVKKSDYWYNSPGMYVFPNGDTWRGSFFERQKHGKGILKRANGLEEVVTYDKDEVVNSLQTSQSPQATQAQIQPSTVTNVRSSEGVYSGQVNKNGQAHGIGELKLNNGSIWNGSFFEGEPRGRGTLTTKEGMKMTGEFGNGGIGWVGNLFIKLTNGDRYQKTFDDNGKEVPGSQMKLN